MALMMTKLAQGSISDDQVTRLAAKHAQTMQQRERAWRAEIAKHKQELKRDYQEYVLLLYQSFFCAIFSLLSLIIAVSLGLILVNITNQILRSSAYLFSLFLFCFV